ncbi:hypothetical protein ASPBRDRAFT_43006 [Aspergillus brasiliensis CBS 101740]|uniref:Uncharacterized protein n=1 Tax=Aspergillus brasiliensis (strain CBS 101740 / IMI 381727 / IBT 21946) TaxID=767769 RepID=A0A1L9UJ19_ASPBC|nr:hypothetical protein ASPBRDRAFT_43006 [Aspergillus brasiliensis CBS 101740]
MWFRSSSFQEGRGGLTSSKLSNWIWAVAASSEHPSTITQVADLMGPLDDLSSAPHPHNSPFRNVHSPAIGDDWSAAHDGQMKRHGPTTLLDPIRLPRLSQTGGRFSFRASGEDNHLAQTGRIRD